MRGLSSYRASLGVVGCVLGAAAVVIAVAGPLNPPSGAVSSSYKTLGEVEPRIAINAANTPGDADSMFKITQPGSYYLTGNLTGVAGKHGIEVVASGVTLDLMGFEVVGVTGSLDGVSVTAPGIQRVAVRNGSLRNWGDRGVDLASQQATSCAAEKLSLSSNVNEGLALSDSSAAEGCIASENGGAGILINISGTLSACVASGNGSSGFAAGDGATLRDCSAYSNGGSGFAVGSAATVGGCSSYNNLDKGFLTGAGSAVSQSTARANSTDGFSLGQGSVITGCAAEANAATGFYVGGGGTIQQCTANENGQNGISLTFRCLALSNTSVLNGGGGGGSIGILALSNNNRIEGNVSTHNQYGILVAGSNNIIVRNTCSGNTTNWSIGSNNVFGPIVDRRSPGSGSVSGNSAASTLGTTDANANFSY